MTVLITHTGISSAETKNKVVLQEARCQKVKTSRNDLEEERESNKNN